MRLSMNVMPRSHRWTILTLSLGAPSLVSCAASPPQESRPAAAPVAPAEAAPPAATSLADSEPRTLAEAEAQLETAQAELDRVALLAPPSPEGGTAAPQSAPAPRDRALPKQAERAEADAEAAPKADNPCQTACRAFSSLARASEAVCRLATDGGARCERAKQLREQASQRVKSCGCGG